MIFILSKHRAYNRTAQLNISFDLFIMQTEDAAYLTRLLPQAAVKEDKSHLSLEARSNAKCNFSY